MNAQISLYYTICIIASFLSISLGSTLFFIKSRSNQANLYLGLLVYTYALFFLPGFFDALGVLDDASFLIRLKFFSGLLTGPLTYLYCKALIQKTPLKFKAVRLHFIPFLLGIIYFSPFFFKPVGEKLAIYQQVVTTGQAPLPQFIAFGLIAFTLVYTLLSIRTVYQFLYSKKEARSAKDLSLYKWLLLLCLFSLCPLFVAFLITTTGYKVIPVSMGLLLIATFIIIIYITLALRPVYFHHYPTHQEALNTEEAKKKYQNSTLQTHQKEQYQKRIIDCMVQAKPYLNPELTIDEFSAQLNIPAYYVSQVINQELGSNFLDFVNRYRILTTKDKLQDPALGHYTILTLAFESGFNSKTAFYTAFKKNVGCTPSQYRKSSPNPKL